MSVSALGPASADWLLKAMGDRTVAALAGGRGGTSSPVCLVVCDSATAAGSTGVLAECYPAHIVSPAADDYAPGEDGGAVLLTILGADGEAGVPVEGQPYQCIISSEVPGDESGSGSDRVAGRPRAFGVASDSGIAPITGESALASDYTFSGSAEQSLGPVITLPEPGFYIISASIAWNTTSATAGVMYGYIRRFDNFYFGTPGVPSGGSPVSASAYWNVVQGANGSGGSWKDGPTFLYRWTGANPGYEDKFELRASLSGTWSGARATTSAGTGGPTAIRYAKVGDANSGIGPVGPVGPIGPAGTPGTNAPDEANAVIGSRIFGF